MSEITCLDCDGRGTFIAAFKALSIPCDRCKGTGNVPEIHLKWYKEGQKHYTARIERRETLLDASCRMVVDAKRLSDAERGCIDPKEVFPEPVKCKHENIIESHGDRKCKNCNKVLNGWFCPDNAPTHKCDYDNNEWCIYCGEPDERK